jgi:hypothetical protein
MPQRRVMLLFSCVGEMEKENRHTPVKEAWRHEMKLCLWEPIQAEFYYPNKLF